MRVGLFGGSFDPIHNGHLIIAEAAVESLRLDRLYLAPTAVPPHKPNGLVASIDDRVAMVRSATDGMPASTMLDVEATDAIAYTVDTLRYLRRRHGDDATLFLVIGGDSLRDFHSWRDPETIRELATLAVFARPGVEVPAVDHVSLPGPLIEISSTTIRARVAAGRTLRGWVPDAVAAYIREHGLYREESC